MASTTSVLSVRSFSVLGKSGVEHVRTVWLTGDFFSIINKKSFVVFLGEEEKTMTETQVFKFRLPKPETNVGMAFLGH